MLAAAGAAWENELGPLLTSAQVRELLVSTVTPLPGGSSPETGAGLLNVAAALRRLDEEAAA